MTKTKKICNVIALDEQEAEIMNDVESSSSSTVGFKTADNNQDENAAAEKN